jgi:hypothetical protein
VLKSRPAAKWLGGDLLPQPVDHQVRDQIDLTDPGI